MSDLKTQVLEEVEQQRQKLLAEINQVPAKHLPRRPVLTCPTCFEPLEESWNYCADCGQKLDWSILRGSEK